MPTRLQPDVAVYVTCFATAFVLRVALSATTVTPDSELYLRIADNVLRHGCYSRSTPDSGECAPTWANQPPGFPLFLVIVKTVTPGTPDDIVIAQCLVYALAVVYALYAIRRSLPVSTGGLLVTGLFLSLSPLTASWSQWVLTETLAASATLWVAAECLRSLSSGSFRTRALAVSLALSLTIRWDLIWLAVPVMLVAWHLRDKGGMGRRLAVVLGAMVAPVPLLVVRAVLVGLPVTPPYMDATPEELPPGILRFWKVTATGQTAASTLLWNVWRGEYGVVASSFDYRSVSDRVDRVQLRAALESLSAVPDGTVIPPEVDAAFAGLAEEAVNRDQASYWTSVLLRRGWSMWGARDTITWSGWFRDHESYLRPYRLALLGLVLAAPFVWPRGSLPQILSVGVLLFVLTRTVFLGCFTALETRYVTPCLPAMEVVAALLLARGRTASSEQT